LPLCGTKNAQSRLVQLFTKQFQRVDSRKSKRLYTEPLPASFAGYEFLWCGSSSPEEKYSTIFSRAASISWGFWRMSSASSGVR